MTGVRKDLEGRSASQDDAIARFLEKVAATPPLPQGGPMKSGARGRLIFALDATMSRQPTWDEACRLQSEMFAEAKAAGGLDIQLVFFRGHGEFRAGTWVSDADSLARQMTGIECRGGFTQIDKMLRHAVAETKRQKVAAIVYVGDACEENVDRIAESAGQLGLAGVRAFVFHEGHDRAAETALREIARLTGGAYCPFDASSAQQLRDLLRAVAAYAAGGKKGLAALSGSASADIKRLIQQIR